MSIDRPPRADTHTWLRRFLRLTFRLFYRFQAEGQENLPADGPVLLASNHQSYYDPILVAIGQDRPTLFMAWAALFRWRPFGWAIRKLGAFPVDLDRHDPGAFRLALANLRQGAWMVIFPEGGRTMDGQLLELREGVARLALHSGATVIPVRIEGAFEAWPKPRPLPHLFGRIKVTYGPPIIPPAGRLDPAARDEATREIMNRMQAFLASPSHAVPDRSAPR